MNAQLNKLLELDYPDMSDRAVLLLLLAVSLGALLVSGLMNLLGFAWWDGALQNLGTEMIGAFATFVLFEKIIGARDRRAAEQQDLQREVRDLIRRTRSSANEIAKDAIDELRERQLLEGATGVLAGQRLREANLVDARLTRANLHTVNLSKADLQRAELGQADLRSANLEHTQLYSAKLNRSDLRGANLANANLYGATLGNANLQQTNLYGADLHSAELWSANLEGATLTEANMNVVNLSGANLRGVSLARADLRESKLADAHFEGADLQQVFFGGASDIEKAHFDERTLLPDARITAVDDNGKAQHDKYWSPEVDMTRYTDSQHPDFWQPLWAAAGYESFRAWTKDGKPATKPKMTGVDSDYKGVEDL